MWKALSLVFKPGEDRYDLRHRVDRTVSPSGMGFPRITMNVGYTRQLRTDKHKPNDNGLERELKRCQIQPNDLLVQSEGTYVIILQDQAIYRVKYLNRVLVIVTVAFLTRVMGNEISKGVRGEFLFILCLVC